MEKLMRSYDKEHMKLAMLQHEQTFKEQVYELHRLYQIQKTLMKSFQGARDDLPRPSAGEGDYEDGIELSLGLGLGLGLAPMGYNKVRSRKRGGTASPNFSSSTTTTRAGVVPAAKTTREGKGSRMFGITLLGLSKLS